MSMNTAGRILVLVGISMLIFPHFIQANDSTGDVALERYYSELELKFANKPPSEIPFQQATVAIKKNDTLVKLAIQHTFPELDFYHLAAAIYQINPSAFKNNDPAILRSDVAIQLPNIRQLYKAKNQFERLNVTGKKLDFFSEKNVMRAGIRYPFGGIPDSTPVLAQVQPNSNYEYLPNDSANTTEVYNNAVVSWDVSLWGKRRAFTEHIEKLAELVARKTNGEFVLNLSYGGLSKPRENLSGIAAGKFEMAQFCAGYHHEKNPSITVLELPFLGVKSLEQERSISQWLFRHPAVLKDFERWNAVALMPSPLPQYNIAGIGEAPKTLEDLSGLSVRATGGIGIAMAVLNAVPTPTIASEVRQALNDGLIEAVAFAPHAHMSFGTVESADWWTTNLNPGTVNCPVVANINAVNSLNPEYQDALYGSINEALDHYINNYNVNTMNAWGPALYERGIERVTFNEEEIHQFQTKVADTAAASWIEKYSALGLPAQELYDLVTMGLAGQNPEGVSTDNDIVISEFTASTKVDSPIQSAVTRIQQTNVAKAESPEVKTVAVMPEDTSQDDNNYLGAPRNGDSVTALSSDPLQYSVEWNLPENVTVGAALDRLASYIGYELVGNDKLVKQNYKRPIPIMQRHVEPTTVGDGFEILSGIGLTIVYDHITRSVMHMAKQTRQSREDLPDCPTDSNVLTVRGDGMYLLPDGNECRF